AAPLCELLYNAATRDGQPDRAFELLRLATRIACATGNKERALQASLAAYEGRPHDEGARADLLDVVGRITSEPALLARARPAIEAVARNAEVLSNGSLVNLADAQNALGQVEVALETLGAALRTDSSHKDALERVVAILGA